MSDGGHTTVSLVLGSGGARGLAHIGVIQELRQSGYAIRSVAGCSMGALVGGIYAAGKLDDFERWVRAITGLDMLTLLDISWGRDGLVKGDKIIGTLIDLVGDVTIDELPIPFTAVAADIENEKEVWLNAGSLFDAIRASISLPLFFTPVKHKDAYLIDGGVLNPVPIAPTFNDNTDLTIAVNLSGPIGMKPVKKQKEREHTSKNSRLRGRLNRFLEELVESNDRVDLNERGMYDVANQAFDTMQGTIARQKLAAYPPDIVIEIARNACGTLEFNRAAEMIEIGRRSAQESLANASSVR